MSTTQGYPPHPTTGVTLARSILGFGAAHGVPIVFAGLLWSVLWWGHAHNVQTVDEAMRHVSWVGAIVLVYVALQARAVLAQPRVVWCIH